MQPKRLFIVLAGSLIYWVLGFLLHKIFENISESFKFLEILISASMLPFILGFITAQLIKSRRAWIYSSISYLLYFIWIYGVAPIYEFQFRNYAAHLFVLVKAYVVLGIISTLFAALGGFLGSLRRMRSS
jgi:hypothetical protein